MSATYLTPGVYVEELPSGAPAVEGVATSNALFIGYARRGPEDRAVRIASWVEYEDHFGGVTADGSSTGVNDLREAGLGQDVDRMGHAVLAYFQNGGKIAYIRRLVDGAGRATSAILQPAPLEFEAVDAGTWADGIAVDVADDPANAGRHVVTVGWRNRRGMIVAKEQYDDVGLADADGEERFLGDLLEEESALVRLVDDPPDDPSLPEHVLRGTHRSGDVSGVDLDLSEASAANRTFRVLLDPAGNTQTTGVVTDRAYSSLQSLATEIERVLRASDDAAPAGATEGLTVRVVRDGDARHLEVRAGMTGDDSRAVVTTGGLGPTLLFDAGDAMTGEQVAAAATTAELFNGDDGGLARADDYADAFAELELNPDVNVVVTPNAAWDDDGRPVVEAAVTHCETMMNRVVIIDPPAGVRLDDPTTVAGLALPTSTYAQLYYPWIRTRNPVHHPDLRPTAPTTVMVPPAGHVAGMWSRIDGRRGVWKAPAGVETQLTGVDGFEFEVGDPQQEVLNPAGVNVLRMRPGYGRVIWGARTLATRADPDWRYVPVRRTAIMIEEALRRGIQWAVFEPNDHRLWSSLRLAAESYLDGLFRAGAFQGEKASEAYRVKCGLDTTMTQGDIDRGYVILRVQFAPLKPAEFVVIQIQQLAGQQ
jgi:uncharacterized protein